MKDIQLSICKNTGKSFSEALILAPTNPQSSEYVVFKNCYECQNTNKKKSQLKYTTCSELVVFMYGTGISMNNLLSYCGLVDANISASEKNLP